MPSSAPPPPSVPLADLLAVAVEAAHAAGRHALASFGGRLDVEWKSDGSPRTAADVEAEVILRGVIRSAFPRHGLLGEEGGEQAGSEPVRWILDPIDGTRTYLRGVPLFGTLVGVEVAGEPVVGVIHLPALGETVAAAQGLGCTWNDRPCRVSACRQLAEALVTGTDLVGKARGAGAFGRLAERSGLLRTWGDCYAYALVATGRAEVALDPEMNLWDSAPLLPILEEAGGRFTDWSGRRTVRGTGALATNGPLHDEVLSILRCES
jgi:histidinol-phosphatase